MQFHKNEVIIHTSPASSEEINALGSPADHNRDVQIALGL